MGKHTKVQVSTESFEKGVTFSPSGRINASNAHILAEGLRGCLEGSQPVIVFDLGRLSSITSSGLRVLLMASRDAKARGGSSVVCNLNGDIEKVFEVSRFEKILPIYESLEEALDAL